MIPGLENAKIVRYGVMHRNCFICSPRYLKPTYQFIEREDLFFAGQMTGVEGYVESAQSGMVAGMNGDETNFQPMKANFGILPDLAIRVKKKERKDAYATRAIKKMKEFLKDESI